MPALSFKINDHCIKHLIPFQKFFSNDGFILSSFVVFQMIIVASFFSCLARVFRVFNDHRNYTMIINNDIHFSC